MGLSNRQRALQDHLTRVAKRMEQKFGVSGIPTDVLIKRVGEKQIALDNLGGVTANAYSFTVISNTTGMTTDDQIIVPYDASLPNGIYGSPAALVMLAKLKAGTDSVDFHVIGDSNAGSPGADGWVNGIALGLIQGCCAAMYATPVFPAGVCYNSVAGSLYSGLGFRADAYLTPVGLLGNAGKSYTDGRLAPNDIKRYFNITGVSLGLGYAWTEVYSTNFVWADGVGLTYSTNELNSIYDYQTTGLAAFGMDTRNALTYRVVHSVMPGNTGGTGSSLSLMFTGVSTGYAGAGPMSSYIFGPTDGRGATFYPPCGLPNDVGFRVSASSGVKGSTGISVAKLTWNADSNRKGVTIGYNFYGRAPGFTTAFGPVAVYLESVHCNKKGWAVSCIAYLGGFTTTTIADQIVKFAQTTDSTDNSGLKTVIKETRERQIEAGGSGNLIVFINSGINDVGGLPGFNESSAIAAYPTNLARITSIYRQIWSELGYPDNDLAFIATISHPTIAGDTNTDGLRAAAQSFSEIQADNNNSSTAYRNVLSVDLTKLGPNGITFGGLTSGNSFNGNRSFYAVDGGGGVHLEPGATGGYSYLSELMIKRCLEYADPTY
jgi:hypothetical protein